MTDATMGHMTLCPIDEIKVNEGRQREGLGGGRDAEVRLNQLMESIKKHGILNPIIISDAGELVAGFRRLTAAKRLGLSAVPTQRLEDLTELEREEIELDENVQRQDLTWQERVNATARINEIKKKQDPNWGQQQTAEVTGTSRAEVNRQLQLAEMMKMFPQLAEASSMFQARSRATALAKAATRVVDVKSNPIDYGKLESKILLGDSVEVIKTIPDASFHHIITDPPFGIDYDRRISDTTNASTQYEDGSESYEKILSMAPDLYRVLKEDGFLIWFLGFSWYEEAKRAFLAAGFNVDEVPIVWDRSGGKCFTRRPDRYFAKGYDIALHCVKGNPEMVIRGKSNVIRVDPLDPGEKEQSVERPIELYQELIKRISVPGEIIADFFVGSGSCAAAAALAGRDFFGVELDPMRRARALKKIQAHIPEGTVL